MVAASFVTVEGFELPFYVALIGACGRKIAYAEHAQALALEAEFDDLDDEALEESTDWSDDCVAAH
jgi:hypothetical protein